TVMLFNSINFLLSFAIIFILFSVIFKTLPDVRIKWRTVWSGALFTSFLFVIGRFLIGLYIEFSDTESTYGAASSIVLILLWVYYTAAILYLGAVFTREYAAHKGIPIEPSEYAVHVELREIEKEVSVIPNTALTTEANHSSDNN